MIAFEVKDMTCGHCVSTITQALKDADRNAQVHIDLAAHRVQVESSCAGVGELADAIKEAGYTPVPVSVSAAASTEPGGSCCGGCR